MVFAEGDRNRAQKRNHQLSFGETLALLGPKDEAKRFLTNAARLGHAKARKVLQQLKDDASNHSGD